MAEHGFYQFYHSFSEFQLKWDIRRLYRVMGNEQDQNDLLSITMQQLHKPIVVVSCLNGIAAIAFVAEILIIKWIEWRNREWNNWGYLKFCI